MTTKLSLLAIALMFVTGFSFVRAEMSHDTKAKVGEKAPDFALTDQDGKTVHLSDFAGKTVVLEWFNEECPIVQRHYSSGDMNKLAKTEMDNGVVWLAINSTHGKSDATNKSAAEKWNMDREILNDSNGDVGHLYGATNTPNMFVIDKSGTLVYAGAIDDNSGGDSKEVKNYVSQALSEIQAGKPVSTPQTKPYGCSVKYAK